MYVKGSFGGGQQVQCSCWVLLQQPDETDPIGRVLGCSQRPWSSVKIFGSVGNENRQGMMPRAKKKKKVGRDEASRASQGGGQATSYILRGQLTD
jgi:hypothetical protein